MNMHVRLFEERERLGLSQEQMAAAGGMKKRAYCYYESGERVPDAAFLTLVADHGVDVYYVLTGVRVGAVTTLTVRETALINNYRVAPEEGKRALETTSAALAQSTAPAGSSLGQKQINVGTNHGQVVEGGLVNNGPVQFGKVINKK